MKKRLISFLLALSMMLSLVPVGAFAATTPTNDNPQHITLTYSNQGNPLARGQGWTYKDRVLTIQEGYEFDSRSLGTPPRNSPGIINGIITYFVINNGVISGGKFGSYTGAGNVENYGIIKD